MTILARWLWQFSLARIAGAAGALLALYVVGEVFDKARYLGPDLGAGRLAEYIALKAPAMLAAFMPIVVLFGATAALIELAMHRETIALRAAGVGLGRLLAPLLAAAAAAGASAFAIGEWGMPAAKRADAIERVSIKHVRPAPGDARWLRDGRMLLRLTPLGGGRFRLLVLAFDADRRWTRRIDAASAVYAGGVWQMRQVTIVEPDGRGGVRVVERPRYEIASRASPGAAEPPPPRFMRLEELRRYARDLKAAGMDDAPYRYAWHRKLAAPFGCLVAMLLAAALCLHLHPRAARAGMAAAAVVALGLGMYVLDHAAGLLAAGGQLPPAFAAWLGNLVFGGLALGLLLQREGY